VRWLEGGATAVDGVGTACEMLNGDAAVMLDSC
jgi:hypothetical protein